MFIIQTLRDDEFALETVFAYELRSDCLIVDESRVEPRFMEFLTGEMHAKLTRDDQS